VAGDGEDLGARGRIAGDAAAEVDQPAGLLMLLALAEEIDLGDDQPAFAVVQADAADVGEQPARAGLELDVAADLAGEGDARIGIARDLGEAADLELDSARAAAHLDDAADRRALGRAAEDRPDGRRRFLVFLDL